jgi:BON domain
MVRYRDVDDSESGRTLLLTAGIIAGLLAGAVVAHRLGGWRGLRRALRAVRGRGAPTLALLRDLLPAGTLSTLLKVLKADELVAALLGHGERAARRRRRRRRPDIDLDEYEVDEVEQAAAGLHRGDDEEVDDDNIAAAPADADEDSEEDGEEERVARVSPEAIEGRVLAAFRRHPVLRQRALEIAVDDDGVLALTGWVRGEREVRVARRVARRVPGVSDVLVDVAVRDVRPDRRRPAAEADATPA